MTVVLTNGLEQVSNFADEAYERRNPNRSKTISLAGLTADYVEAEPAIKPILAEIYAEHKDELDQYLSPYARLMLIFSQLALGRFARNNAEFGERRVEKCDVPEKNKNINNRPDNIQQHIITSDNNV